MAKSSITILRVRDLRALSTITIESPSLVLTAQGDVITVGPLYIAGAAVCIRCVQHWVEVAGWDRPEAAEPSEAAVGRLEQIAGEVAKQFESGEPIEELFRTIFEIDVARNCVIEHALVPSADCPVCGNLRRREWPLTAHCGRLLGLVSNMTVTGDALWGSFSAMGEFRAPIPAPHIRRLLKTQVALGKGETKSQAIDSCIGEAIERYSITYDGKERVTRGRIDELAAIDPREILLFSEGQFAMRDRWNAANDDRYWIPERFDSKAALDFLVGVDLSSGREVYVPAACCLMWYEFGSGDRRFASADSIGCAAGRSFNSAAASALLESIERDAVAIWWYNKLRRPAACIETFGSPYLSKIERALRTANRELSLLDITSDVEIPTYVAVSPLADGTEPVFAAAAHVSPRQAACKAAAEVGQLIFSAIQQGGIDAELHTWLNRATVHSELYLAPRGIAAVRPEPECELEPGQVVSLCAQRMMDRGLRPILVDQSHPEVLLKTVRAIAPGLRHIWGRFAPGRLYEIPAHLGWLNAPSKEAELNSIRCMI